MKKIIKNIVIIICIALGALLFLAQMMSAGNSSRRVSKNITLSRQDKIPYGSYLSYELLRNRYPETTLKNVFDPLHIQLNKIKDTNSIYIILTKKLILSEKDVNALLHFVSKGNQVLIGAGEWDEKLSDTLHFRGSYIPLTSFYGMIPEDTFHVQLVNVFLDTTRYFYKGRPLVSSFTKVDSPQTKILGLSDKGGADFIYIPVGKGSFLLHTDPLVFSNYFLLQRKNFRYLDAAFSYLTTTPREIFWDNYYYHHVQPAGSFSPFEAILKYPSLRYAFWLSLLLAALYILFEMKRRQRIIPVMPPLQNTSVEFVQTLSALYLNKKDNRQIADKQINHLLEYIRARFNLFTTILDESFLMQLSRKSGIPLTEINELFTALHDARINFDLSDQQLIQLNFLIEIFYKITK